jgi:hypothetical protein
VQVVIVGPVCIVEIPSGPGILAGRRERSQGSDRIAGLEGVSGFDGDRLEREGLRPGALRHGSHGCGYLGKRVEATRREQEWQTARANP